MIPYIFGDNPGFQAEGLRMAMLEISFEKQAH